MPDSDLVVRSSPGWRVTCSDLAILVLRACSSEEDAHCRPGNGVPGVRTRGGLPPATGLVRARYLGGLPG